MDSQVQDQVSQVAKIMAALFSAFFAGLTREDYTACMQLLTALSASASAQLPHIAKLARLP